MPYHLLADAVVLLHLAFILFAAFGALLLFRYPRLLWLHLPAALWGAVIEFSGWVCPLTPLENHLRALAGDKPYSGDFIERYLVPLIYPAALTRDLQMLLGIGCVTINIVLYVMVIHNGWKRTSK